MTDFVIVTGWPKSGNTWLSRLLGQVLNCPVGGILNAVPLATEGGDRPNHRKILQLHLKPTMEDQGKMLASAWWLSVPHYDGSPLIHIVRDPRDVVVSVNHYWQIGSIEKALDCVGLGERPTKAHGSWSWYVQKWLDCPLPVQHVRYEDLHADTKTVVLSILDRWNLDPQMDIDEAIILQSFDMKRAQIERESPNSRPYGATIQLRNMRKGIVGDYMNHFDDNLLMLARDYFGHIAGAFDYAL